MLPLIPRSGGCKIPSSCLFTCCVCDRHDVKNSRCMKTFHGNSYRIIAVLELSFSVTVFILILLPAGLFCCESEEGECTSIQAGLAFN